MEKLDRLIEILLAERGEKAPAMTDDQKPRFFRAMCNVREPMPVTDEFLLLQDQYLQELSARRGVVDASSFTYSGGIALWQGDITLLDTDAIVNACNSKLLGCFIPEHHCIDNCIHSFAGVQVRLDCNDIMKGGDEPNGSVKVTGAYNLPSKYIFHTVGPIVRGRVTEKDERELCSCYTSCLDKAAEMGIHSIAFCCLSTGVFGYPKAAACKLAVSTVRAWLDKHAVDLFVVFNVFTDEDAALYRRELGI